MVTEKMIEAAKVEANALADRAGIDIGDDRDMFVDDLVQTLTRFAALSTDAEPVAVKAKKPKLPPISDELYEMYPSMSAQTHADAVKDYARSAVAAALSAQVQDVAGWQPIETAPKDGSEILLYREDCGVILGRWISCSDFVVDGDPSAEFCQSDEEWEEPDWFGADFVSGFRITNDGLPTHWMPLPAAPAAKLEGKP